tara:strand:+ start:3113 stop:3232 length:120 start_codon:yes stop_codon:yes gene_type:complete
MAFNADPETLCRALVLPPALSDIWICSNPRETRTAPPLR